MACAHTFEKHKDIKAVYDAGDLSKIQPSNTNPNSASNSQPQQTGGGMPGAFVLQGGKQGKWCGISSNKLYCNLIHPVEDRSTFATVPVDGYADQIYIRYIKEERWCEAKKKKFICKKNNKPKQKHKFIYEDWGDDYISFKKAKNGKVCSDELNDGVRCDRNYVNVCERFKIHAHKDIFPIEIKCADNDMMKQVPQGRWKYFDNERKQEHIKAASTASTCAMVLTPTVNGGYSRCAEVCSSHNLKCRRARKISINQNDPEGQCIYQTHPEDPSYEGAWGCYAARDKANTNGHYYCECGENTIAPTPAPTKSPTYPSFRRRFSKCYTPPVYNSGPTQEFVALALKEGKVYGVLNNEQCEWKCQQWPECRAGMNFQGVNGITCLLFPYGISQSAPYACQECGPNQMGWEYEDQCSHTFQKY